MRYADGPTAQAAIHVDAPPERVWALVSDIHLVASLSSEVQEVEWVEPGSTFRGHNRHPAVGDWTTTSHVVACEAPRAFSWAVADPASPAATWGFELVPDGRGTLLRQWARMGPGRSNLNRIIEAMPDKEERLVAGRLREWLAGMDANLAALKELAERLP